MTKDSSNAALLARRKSNAVPNTEWSPMLELLARMLCYGIRADESLASQIVGKYDLDPGFIHGVIWEVANHWHVNTAFVDSMTRSPLAVTVEEIEGQLLTKLANNYLSCRPISQPPSIETNWPQYGKIRQFIRMHNPRAIFATPVRECVFGAIGKGCTFCTYDMNKPKPVPPPIFMEMLRRVIDDTGMDVELALGAATPNLSDHGIDYFADIVRRVRQEFDIATSVEMVPPPNLRALDLLIDSGVQSLIMSIEIWDDAIREQVCPGKSVISKQTYLEAWARSLKRLGSGQVSSVLLVGLEPEESTKSGIDALVEIGVIPTLIPFRPYDASGLRDQPLTDHHQYLRCAVYESKKLRLSQLSPLSQSGCTKCGACSLETFLSEGQTIVNSELRAAHLDYEFSF